ncbi:hypothetical protein F4678DRAFT_211800 [Xylaria arbuscula]|nr:hypothetical protein F4678DRAFT_211800 [Xylaria arbuscula]
MSARVFQATTRLTRQRRQILAGSCLGLTVGTGVAMRSSPRIHFDSAPFSTSSPAFSNAPRGNAGSGRKESLDSELMKQLSGGSVAGFVSGLLVSVFSRTLVLLFGVSVVLVQVAARYGINILDRLRLRQRLSKSRVLAALERDPAFKLSFGLFFALSALTQF